jgi:hypothetical protein
MDARREALERVEALFLRAPSSGGSRQLTAIAPRDEYKFTSTNCGSGEWIRTTDPRLMSLTETTIHQRIQSVKDVMYERTRRWLIGAVAVKISRQVSPNIPSEEAPCIVE